MACMEHYCWKCMEYIFNNKPGPEYCPECGSIMQATFDEQFCAGEKWG